MTRLAYWFHKTGAKSALLAEHIEKTPETIMNYRSGSTQPPLDVAKKIADFTGIPVADLMEEVDENGNALKIVA